MRSAARIPSTAALTIPPAYPAPSPTGYKPGQETDSPVAERIMRTGALVLLSTAVNTPSRQIKPAQLRGKSADAGRHAGCHGFRQAGPQVGPA